AGLRFRPSEANFKAKCVIPEGSDNGGRLGGDVEDAGGIDPKRTAAARSPVGQAPADADQGGANSEQDAAEAERYVEDHDFDPRGGWIVTEETTTCSWTPARTVSPWRPSQMLL